MEEKEILKAFGSVYDYLNDKTIYDLRTLAREFGVNAPSAARKHDLILRIIIAAAALAEPEKVSRRGARVKAGAAPAESVTEVRKLIEECRSHRPYDNYIPESERIEFNDVIKSEPVYGYGDQLYRGFVQRMADGSWRVYPENRKNIIKIPVLAEEERDRYSLREGDHVVGYVVEAAGKPPVFTQPQLVNGRLFSDPRHNFEEFAAAFPMQKYSFAESKNFLVRAAEVLSPLGKGQRALLVAPSGTGKTAFLREAAQCLAKQAKVILVLLGQRPEESVEFESLLPDTLVFSAPFDSTNFERVQFARLALERAKRIAEEGGDAVILLDSMHAYVRAAEKVCSDEESGMLECKKFFASARRLDGSGTLTVLATVDPCDAEEFADAGNCIIRFSDEYVRLGIPALDMLKSETRRSDLLLDKQETDLAKKLRSIAAEKGMAEAYALAETIFKE